MTFTSILFGSCLIISWIYAIAFLALLLENRRFWSVHRKKPAPKLSVYPRTCIIIPCKGLEHNLGENLAGFMLQDHPNYEVIFVVESGRDPAVPVIRKLIGQNPTVTSKMVVAGIAETCGQKVHNLRAATKEYSKEVDILVFADSDAAPNNTWLRWLTQCIGRKRLGARTGYRWMVPRDNSLATLLGVTINNILASMLGKGNFYLAWGGSWAVHRRVFEEVGVRQAWSGSLSDDLVASRALRLSKLNIGFEPQCICNSPVKFTPASLFEFLRRQFLIARRYTPLYLYAGLLLTLAVQIGFWGGLIVGAIKCVAGDSTGYLLLGSSGLLYAMGVVRSALRQTMGRGHNPEWRLQKKARKFDLFCGPFTGVITLGIMLASLVGNRITWRGIHYHIGPSGRIQTIARTMQIDNWGIDKPQPNASDAKHLPDREVFESNTYLKQVKKFEPRPPAQETLKLDDPTDTRSAA